MINAYISHPYASDPVGNVKKAKEIVDSIAQDSIAIMKSMDELSVEKDRYDEVVCPVCPLLVFPDSMSEISGIERKHALAFCLSLIETCDELWVCGGELTPGMRLEITRASELGKPVRWHADLKHAD